MLGRSLDVRGSWENNAGADYSSPVDNIHRPFWGLPFPRRLNILLYVLSYYTRCLTIENARGYPRQGERKGSVTAVLTRWHPVQNRPDEMHLRQDHLAPDNILIL